MFFDDFKAIYRSAWRFAFACPILFAIPVLVELGQHVIELQADMYSDPAGAIAAEADPLRLQFGFVKTLAITLPTYWFIRYILFGQDAARAARAEMPALGLWAVTFALFGVHAWLSLFGPSLVGLLGLGTDAAPWLSGAVFVLSTVLSIYLMAWMSAWAVGNSSIGPLRSFSVMQGSFWYALGLFVAGLLPLMIPHYGLAIAAVLWLPGWLDWVVMLLDSVLVGFLALTMAGATAHGAMRAAGRKGIALVPSTGDEAQRFVAEF